MLPELKLSGPITELSEPERRAKQWLHICHYDQLLQTKEWLVDIKQAKGCGDSEREKELTDYSLLEKHYYNIFKLLFNVYGYEEDTE